LDSPLNLNHADTALDTEAKIGAAIIKLWVAITGPVTVRQAPLPATVITMPPFVIGVTAAAPFTAIIAVSYTAFTTFFSGAGLANALGFAWVPITGVITKLNPAISTGPCFAGLTCTDLDTFFPRTPFTSDAITEL
jgi:hypothetical protein